MGKCVNDINYKNVGRKGVDEHLIIACFKSDLEVSRGSSVTSGFK